MLAAQDRTERKMAMKEAYFILYVSDQAESALYYGEVLDRKPILDVPGITEFELRDGSILGLIPVQSAGRLLGKSLFRSSSKVPKAELYLVVDDPGICHQRALDRGATELSPMQLRDWGHRAAYSMDHDGHVLAFAEKVAQAS
jgi:hypothetical protein